MSDARSLSTEDLASRLRALARSLGRADRELLDAAASRLDDFNEYGQAAPDEVAAGPTKMLAIRTPSGYTIAATITKRSGRGVQIKSGALETWLPYRHVLDFSPGLVHVSKWIAEQRTTDFELSNPNGISPRLLGVRVLRPVMPRFDSISDDCPEKGQ